MADIEQSTLRALIRGEKDAYVSVIDRLYKPVYRFAYRLCNDSAMAEDITQETFLVVWEQVGSFKGKSRFSTWVFGIAYRRFLRMKDKPAVRTMPIEQTSCESTDDLCEQVELADLRARVRQALEALPDLYRHVVFLVYIQGLTYGEAAEVLDVPIGTVKSRMHYAFNILRGALGGEEEAEHEMPQPDCLSE